MRLLAWSAAAFAVFALVLAPYTVVVSQSARGEKLSDLGIVAAQEGSCGEGKGFIRILTAVQHVYVLGENGRVVRLESDEVDPQNELPTVTFGAWDEKSGEISLNLKSRHKVGPNDGLCADLFAPQA